MMSRLYIRVIYLSFLLFVSAASYEISANSKTAASYESARNVRTQYGHAAAVPLYQSLLQKNPNDLTAGSHIAAAKSSPHRHDRACRLTNENFDEKSILNDIAELRSLLRLSGYNNQQIQTLFNIPHYKRELGRKNHKLSYAKAPVYVKPVPAGSMSSYPLLTTSDSDEPGDTSLKCLVTMFLLGLCVPHETARKLLVGGEKTITLLKRLGFLYSCEINPSLLVPYVHLFPIDLDCEIVNNINEESGQLVLVTDLHPTILNRISVGSNEDGTVMYIGPDSLALVQHLPLSEHFIKIENNQEKSEDYSILDFCSGSGIQAISALTAIQHVRPNAKAVCVDINDRALRFSKFNAILNGVKPERLTFVKADLSTGEVLPNYHENEGNICNDIDSNTVESKRKILFENNLYNLLISYVNVKCMNGDLLQSGGYDLITANPPFIPVPSSTNDTENTKDQNVNTIISQRYGLFSSGGKSGEEVLESILRLSGRLLQKPVPGRRGFLAIVSEFMDPPCNEDDESSMLLDKIKHWWSSVELNDEANTIMFAKCNSIPDVVRSKGILFTNEYPLKSSTYSARRANDQSEYTIWTKHLDTLGVRSISPGLLFLCSSSESHWDKNIKLLHRKVPRTELGSIWSPSNYHSVDFTKCQWQTIY